jgi:hypothetical protein
VRKSRREKLQDAKKGTVKATELNDLDDLIRLILGGEYNPTQKRAIHSPERIWGYKGPAGCAKTSTLAAAGLIRALTQPGSKGFVSRNDYNDLMDTTMLRLQEMLNRLPKDVLLDRDKSPPMKWWIQPIMEGEPSQITFMGLKDDVVGVEANWWIIDEMNEVEENRIHQINARMRAAGGDYMIAGAFNPPDKHHWLYAACTGRDFQDRKIPGKDAWMKLFEPQSRENTRNLPDNYYELLAATLPEDQKQRFVEGEWGSTFEGQPVYREFKYGMHVFDRLEYDPSSTLYRFWDFGYARPCCIWAQLDWEGRLNVLHEILGQNIEATAFARDVKTATLRRFPNARDIVDFGDPAVVQKKDTGSTLGMLHQEGIVMRYQTSTIEKGAQLIRQRLNLLIDGEPALKFDRRGVPILINSLKGGYHLDDHGIKPVKDGYYDHPADAFRYGILNMFGGGVSKVGLGELPGNVSGDNHETHQLSYHLPLSVASEE